jgi:hypothetical protein
LHGALFAAACGHGVGNGAQNRSACLGKRRLRVALAGATCKDGRLSGTGINTRTRIALPFYIGFTIWLEQAERRLRIPPKHRRYQTGKPLSLLALGDNRENRDILSRMLKNIGCSVLAACNGVEALSLLALHSIDLAFMDIRINNNEP